MLKLCIYMHVYKRKKKRQAKYYYDLYIKLKAKGLQLILIFLHIMLISNVYKIYRLNYVEKCLFRLILLFVNLRTFEYCINKI